MEVAEQYVIKVDFPYPAPVAFQSEEISRKSLPDKTKTPLPFNFTTIVNAAHGQLLGITR